MLSLALAASIALNPDVSQSTIRQTICVKGYSSTVRPSTSYTNPIKFRLMRQDGIPQSDKSEWALDHRIPISLGGHPRRIENLQLLTAKETAGRAVSRSSCSATCASGRCRLPRRSRRLLAGGVKRTDDTQGKSAGGSYWQYAARICASARLIRASALLTD